MKAFAVCLALLCAGAIAQTAQTPPPPAANTQQNEAMRFPEGTLVPAELQKTVDAHKLKSGDKVEAVVFADLHSQSGEIIIPKGTKVMGHVTEVKQKSKEAPGSTLGMVFEKLAMKDGKEVPFPAEIQAVRKNTPQNTLPAGNGSSAGGEASGMPTGGGSGSRTGGMASGGAAGRSSYPGGAPAADSDHPATQTQSGAPEQLTAESKGPIGFEDLSMQQAADGTTLTSQKQNVKLESGTQMILRVRK
jgi:hypothetical protein